MRVLTGLQSAFAVEMFTSCVLEGWQTHSCVLCCQALATLVLATPAQGLALG